MTAPRISGRAVTLSVCFVLYAQSVALAGTFPAASESDLDEIEALVRSAQFLSRTTFGPTKDDIADLAAEVLAVGEKRAFSQWIDDQFAIPATYHHPLAKQMILDDGFRDFVAANVRPARYRHYPWWHTALSAPDQLRQRMAWALSQIFVINQSPAGFGTRRMDASGEPQYLGIVDYYDMLLENAFGNYRDLLEDVTLHPIMGVFLSHLRNPKGDPATGQFPDENYAREVEQLLSIGLYELKRSGVIKTDSSGAPIPAYDNDDIRSFARVFTGLTYARSRSFTRAQPNFHEPMMMREDYHDTGAKRLLRGTVLPPGQPGMKDISDALDNLSQHSNVGPFIGRLLIQRFVKSNPTRSYIRSVTAAFESGGSGGRGNFRAVLKAILLHPEAMNSLKYRTLRKSSAMKIKGKGTEHSRMQEPVLRYTAFLRAFDTISNHPSGYFQIASMYNSLHQEVYQAPHVFNFYLPNHRAAGPVQSYEPSTKVPNGTLYTPEFEIFDSVTANRIANRFRIDVRDAAVNLRGLDANGLFSFELLLNFSEEEALAANPNDLVRQLDLLLCSGTMNDKARTKLAKIVSQETNDPAMRARGAILSMLTSPDCAIHQ